jgi:hypothetical protein
MGWEERNGNRYFYRKARVNGRVVSEYIGAGAIASLIEKREKWKRKSRQIKAREQRKIKNKVEAIDRELSELERKTKELVESFLSENGFYKTGSREWRLKTK